MAVAGVVLLTSRGADRASEFSQGRSEV